jgi:hypothetical protein
MWLYTLFQTGTILAARLNGYCNVRMGIVFFLLAISVVLGYSMLWAGTENNIYKYGKSFSAMQFMLSPNREHYLGQTAIAARYCFVHLLVVGVVCVTQLTAMKLLELMRGKRIEYSG